MTFSALFTLYPKARKLAVENFVISAVSDSNINRANLARDTKLYNWNNDTRAAIRHKLKLESKI